MIYITKNENIFEKYKVDFDKTKLEELLIKVIKRCGEIHHEKKECELQTIPKSNSYRYFSDGGVVNILYYTNVKKKKSGKTITHYYEYTPFEEDLYYCEYIKFIAPNFAYFIERIMCGDLYYISALFEKNVSVIKNFPMVREKIDELSLMLTKIQEDYMIRQKAKIDELNKKYSEYNIGSSPTNEQYKKISKLMKELRKLEKETKKKIDNMNKELSDLLKIRDLNKNQEPIDNYFIELLDLVHFTLIDSLDVSELDRVKVFFENKEEIKKQLLLK